MLNVHACRNAGELFGSTELAGSVPDVFASSPGPVYLEGRLVLSLSFQLAGDEAGSAEHTGDALESYRIWDELAGTWFASDLVLRRYEDIDEVVRTNPTPRVVWRGALDTRARVIMEPDLESAGFEINQAHDLCWKRA